MRDSAVEFKKEMRDKVEIDTKKYLEAGGTITVYKRQTYSDTEYEAREFTITTQEKRWKNGKR